MPFERVACRQPPRAAPPGLRDGPCFVPLSLPDHPQGLAQCREEPG